MIFRKSLSFKTLVIVAAFIFFQNCLFAQTAPREVSSTSFTFYKNGVSLKLNHFSSPAVDIKNTKIDRLVIVVHGTNRNPYTYHKNMRLAAEKAGVSEKTLIISPGFIMERDLNENMDLLGDDHIFWTNSGWKQGDTSVNSSAKNKRTQQLSSFEVMDSIIWQTLNSGKFPNIKHVVVSGNSAGGQFLNRYIGGNLIHESVKKKFGIEIKYLVAAASSYTYQTAERPVIGSPGKYFIPADTSCNKGFNNYRYGMEGLNDYMQQTGKEKIVKQYGERKSAYLVGAQDNDVNDSQLDKSCGALLQGRERKERIELFVDYLHHLYGRKFPLAIVDNSGHDNGKMFASPEGMKWLFQ
jgi:hypothetical protein